VLTPDQFRSVLAHEMGHIAGDDSKFQHKIYRLHGTWQMLLFEFAEENSAANILFVPFFEWYVPFFYAYTLALRRADEYAADKMAARAVGAEKAADALIVGELFARGVMAQQRNEPRGPEEETKWLAEALAENDDPNDEHPCLRNRLRGYRADTPSGAPAGGSVRRRKILRLPPAETRRKRRDRVSTGVGSGTISFRAH
jgi:Zn-dependent protease with chaperone function